MLQLLTRAGLLLSWRGNDGGFEILPAGQNATLRTVIEAVDGPLFLNVCVISGRVCLHHKQCPAHPVWIEAQQSLIGVLDRRTIAQLARQEQPSASRQTEIRKKQLPGISSR